MNGGFHPLCTFMDKETYERVVDEMRLPDGTVWPIPIVLDINEKAKNKLDEGSTLSLCDPEGVPLATLKVAAVWRPDKRPEAVKVYGTDNSEHPGVDYLLNQSGDYYVSGKLTPLTMPKHYDFLELRQSPKELKAMFKKNGYDKVVGFQTRNPIHRAHYELTLRAAEKTGAHILLHPVVGMTKPGDIDSFTRTKCYRSLMKYYPENTATLSLLPLAMRMAGPREALWHAIIRKNYGCTHFIVGRDHAGPGADSLGREFYAPYAAQDLVKTYAEELGITILTFSEMVYAEDEGLYKEIDTVSIGNSILTISGTQLRKMLRDGADIPDWFSFPEVIAELRKMYPPRSKQGVTLFFTGLSGAGKSTIANAVAVKLMELQDKSVTLLDGDLVRLQLSSELGFSKEHRSLNVRRVGFVASEITKNGGIAICAMIAPYEADRIHNKKLISERGGYIEIYVSTPLDECEKRDIKGLYALAREGKIESFTGISDVYETPIFPDIAIDTTCYSVSEAADLIVSHLVKEGYL